MNTDILIGCRGLSKVFSGTRALDGVDLEIGRGKIVGLLGPNGSGKTTLIKILNGLIRPTGGVVLVDGCEPGPHTKSVISYLPDKSYFANWMKVKDLVDLFEGFYPDFDRRRCEEMCASLDIGPDMSLKEMSKGTREKIQLIMVMSRRAQLYLLDEPIAGVDPAARDYILNTIINNYNEEGTIMISTHLITDIERILDEVVFLRDGRMIRHEAVDDIRSREGKSIDQVFREDFAMIPAAPYVPQEGVWQYRQPEVTERREGGASDDK
jgi:ABC-2 type transport system ATP-binding protein